VQFNTDVHALSTSGFSTSIFSRPHQSMSKFQYLVFFGNVDPEGEADKVVDIFDSEPRGKLEMKEDSPTPHNTMAL
jgi:hypothetical protein